MVMMMIFKGYILTSDVDVWLLPFSCNLLFPEVYAIWDCDHLHCLSLFLAVWYFLY